MAVVFAPRPAPAVGTLTPRNLLAPVATLARTHQSRKPDRVVRRLEPCPPYCVHIVFYDPVEITAKATVRLGTP